MTLEEVNEAAAADPQSPTTSEDELKYSSWLMTRPLHPRGSLMDEPTEPPLRVVLMDLRRSRCSLCQRGYRRWMEVRQWEEFEAVTCWRCGNVEVTCRDVDEA